MSEDRARDTFAAAFGEDQAVAIEAAAMYHFGDLGTAHEGDQLGSQPFRYHFLKCIGQECITRDEFRKEHSINAAVEDMREWAKDPERGDLAGHDGDVPDYLALLIGIYTDWVLLTEDEPEPETADEEVAEDVQQLP